MQYRASKSLRAAHRGTRVFASAGPKQSTTRKGAGKRGPRPAARPRATATAVRPCAIATAVRPCATISGPGPKSAARGAEEQTPRPAACPIATGGHRLTSSNKSNTGNQMNTAPTPAWRAIPTASRARARSARAAPPPPGGDRRRPPGRRRRRREDGGRAACREKGGGARGRRGRAGTTAGFGSWCGCRRRTMERYGHEKQLIPTKGGVRGRPVLDLGAVAGAVGGGGGAARTGWLAAGTGAGWRRAGGSQSHRLSYWRSHRARKTIAGTAAGRDRKFDGAGRP